MITTAQAKLLKKLWLAWELGPCYQQADPRRLLPLTLAESKGHDLMRPPHVRRGLSIGQEARYFALKRLAEYAIEGDKAPDVANYWHFQQSVYGAYALVHDRSTCMIVTEWAATNRAELTELLTWEYAELNK